jgi:hypothetical protein
VQAIPSASSIYDAGSDSSLLTATVEAEGPNRAPECQPIVRMSAPYSAFPTRGPTSRLVR